MANTTLNTIKGFYALQAQREQMKANGIAADEFAMKMNKAMGIVGWIVMGVQLIGTALKATFDAYDMRIDKQIQQLAENVEYLQGRFEEFEKALDKAFSTTQVESFTKALSDNIDRQIASYERMRNLEEDKKKTDQSKIDEYNDAIKDLSEQRKEIFEEQQSKVTAGILDDALSAAEGFVDAWYEAFKETGDGLSGLRENFKEMLTGLIKKQAAMQIVGHYTKMYSDWLAGYVDVAGGDAMLTADEAKEWAAKVKETMPELNAMLENFFSSTQELLQEEGSLSELSKGIQGVTESTAQVLEALLNSMRFYVADSNTQLKNIANAFASNDVERNPLLNELRQQTALIRSIESMFDSVIGRGSGPHSGAYLKVLM
jgi:flagellar biosynthesis chaperone FliJ